MLRIFKANQLSSQARKKLLIRQSANDTTANAIVSEILERIAQEGKSAVFEYSRKYDGIAKPRLNVEPEEFDEAEKKLAPELKQAFQQAAANIEAFHVLQKKQLKNKETTLMGTRVGFCYQPYASAGIYVPGGLASYPSSVLMGAIPAKVAKIPHRTLITPPNKKDGSVDPAVLYCAKLAKVHQVIPIGGVQGIATATYGLNGVPSDIIVGPGNRYVTAAKTLLAAQGEICIDLPAGPSEVLVIADESARTDFVAADLLSQAEHGSDSVAVLLCCSFDFAQSVNQEIQKGIKQRPGRKELKSESIREHSFALVFDTWEELYSFANDFGAEHLELCVKDPQKIFLEEKRIYNAGSVFLGHYAPVALGDYFSGTNHVLPTGGASRFYSGLNTESFLKRISYQYPTKESLQSALEPILLMSRHEGLEEEHGHSVAVRFSGVVV